MDYIIDKIGYIIGGLIVFLFIRYLYRKENREADREMRDKIRRKYGDNE